MNYLVTLDAQAGELEKILSGMKRMIVKACNSSHPTPQAVRPGDSLYFLRGCDDCALRVKATVVRLLSFTNPLEADQSLPLKELQPGLQLTESQYNHWSAQKQLLVVEFDCAQKIDVVRVAPGKVPERSEWLAFEELSQVT